MTEEEFSIGVDAFYRNRNPLLHKHREAVRAHGDAVAEVVSLGLHVRDLEKQIDAANNALAAARDRKDLALQAIETAMGDLLSYQDKRPVKPDVFERSAGTLPPLAVYKTAGASE